MRPTDSDLFVAAQVFGWEEYALPPVIARSLNALAQAWTVQGIIPVIVDAGANVGYSAIYFASGYANATVLAVEPDPETFACMERNTSSHSRIMPVEGALWSDDGGLNLERASEGSWATATVPAAGPKSTASFTIAQLLERVPNGRILILKLDVEGAERSIVESALQPVRDAPCIIVEPHDFMHGGAGSLVPLYRAIAGKEIDTLVQGENIVLVASHLNSVAP